MRNIFQKLIINLKFQLLIKNEKNNFLWRIEVKKKSVDYSDSEDDFSDSIDIKIDRKNVFEDAFNTFMGLKLEKFIHQSFSIEFNGEEGSDQGLDNLISWIFF